jgi:hypothetical protein
MTDAFDDWKKQVCNYHVVKTAIKLAQYGEKLCRQQSCNALQQFVGQIPFPKTWRTHRGRGHKAAKYILIDAKRIFMTDAYLS